MRVVRKSNFQNETFSEEFVTGPLTRDEAEEEAERLNSNLRNPATNPLIYEVVPDDYKLYKWEP